MINRIFIFLAIVIFIYTFRWSFYDFYGKSFNEERERLGVLEIPDEWITSTCGTKTKLWKSENILEVKKGRYGKEVLVEDGVVFIERDRIVNKEENRDEAVEITYSFNKEPKNVYKYWSWKGGSILSEKELNQEEFYKILKEWEIDLN